MSARIEVNSSLSWINKAHSREFAAAVKASEEIVLPLGPRALRAAIERPAVLAGLDCEAGLIETLVHEVEGQPGDFPLLQFALEILWREREGARMSWAAYERIGKVR